MSTPTAHNDTGDKSPSREASTSQFEREFNQARKEQGFKSQAHLDAWFRYYDHTQTCTECQKPGKGFETSDGVQPTQNRCDVALRLSQATTFAAEGKAFEYPAGTLVAHHDKIQIEDFVRVGGELLKHLEKHTLCGQIAVGTPTWPMLAVYRDSLRDLISSAKSQRREYLGLDQHGCYTADPAAVVSSNELVLAMNRAKAALGPIPHQTDASNGARAQEKHDALAALVEAVAGNVPCPGSEESPDLLKTLRDLASDFCCIVKQPRNWKSYIAACEIDNAARKAGK